MTKPNSTPQTKIWLKPSIDVTAVKLAQYYHVSRTDEGSAEHHS